MPKKSRIHVIHRTAHLGLAALCLLATGATAQRPALTLLAGPTAAYRTIAAEEGFGGVAELYHDAERVAVLSEVGLRHSQHISRRGSMSGTVFYSALGYDYLQADLRFGSQWNGSEFDPGISPEPVAAVRPVVGHRFHYVTVPIEYAYAIADDWQRFTLSVRGGAEPGILVSQRVRLRANDDSRYSRDLDADLRGFSLSLRASLSLAYELTPAWSLVAEPNYRRQVTPLNDGPLVTRLHSAGFLLGMQHRL